MAQVLDHPDQRIDWPRPVCCFTQYDLRGRVGLELTPEIATRVGYGFARVLQADQIVIGRDVRASSPALSTALADGIQRAGVDVLDIGLTGTEEVYAAVDTTGAGGGIMVTASHNPIEYNGFKFVGPQSRPLTQDEFDALRRQASDPLPDRRAARGTLERIDLRASYAARVTSFVDPARIGPVHILVNAGHGTAGPSFDAIVHVLEAAGAQLRVTRINHAPDPQFPAGIPNPLLDGNRAETRRAVIRAGADFGLAWDGDFDRCFFFDATGAFVPGEYMVALIARALLARTPGARILHDRRVMGAITETVRSAGGRPVAAQTGHVYMKRALRECGALYGGEMSGHHYFREFMCCDSGMIPWLIVAEMISMSGRALHDWVAELRTRYPSSGEINYRVDDVDGLLSAVERRYRASARAVDTRDGLSLECGAWRMNLRKSTTEPLVRLNVETGGDADLLARLRAELDDCIRSYPEASLRTS